MASDRHGFSLSLCLLVAVVGTVLQLSPAQIYDIVLFIDHDGDCLVSFDEFKRAFTGGEQDGADVEVRPEAGGGGGGLAEQRRRTCTRPPLGLFAHDDMMLAGLWWVWMCRPLLRSSTCSSTTSSSRPR